MYHDDWLMSQIRLLAAAIAKIIFRKDVIFYEVKDDENKNETDELFLYLRTLLDSGDINTAEDLLFESLQPDDQDLLLLAVDFYQRLNDLSDEDLVRSHFSRAEIYDGLQEVQRIYGLTF
jgi:hypothetical protein